MSMTITELRPALLLAMLQAHDEIPDDSDDFQFDLIEDAFLKYNLDAKRRAVELCAKEFRDQGLIEIEEFDGSEGETYFKCSMTAEGIDRAEKLRTDQPAGFFEQPGGLFAEAHTALPSASTAPVAITTTIGEEITTTRGEAVVVPAADRYVSVKDNQPAFDELVARLSAIKDEYARDHNHLAAEPAVIEMLSEIDAVLAQIKRGVVRLGQIAYGLLPSFNKVCIALAAYPALVQLIQDATPYAQEILNFFGLM